MKNRYAGRCWCCGAPVDEGKGEVKRDAKGKHAGKWVLRCASCVEGWRPSTAALIEDEKARQAGEGKQQREKRRRGNAWMKRAIAKAPPQRKNGGCRLCKSGAPHSPGRRCDQKREAT